MIGFAANSLLCRGTLRQATIDPATFTFGRLIAGTLALSVFVRISKKTRPQSLLHHGSWISGFALFVYAAAFSFAYIHLAAGTGALLLFGAVQATMIFWGAASGERLDALQFVGLLTAILGVVLLLLPGIVPPPIAGSALMISAGIAWGVYSLRPTTTEDAITTTAGNFWRAIPFAACLSLVTLNQARFHSLGLIYAAISGAITSDIGYVIWYAALPALKRTTAATVQLSVPVIATAGGILFLHEPVTLREVTAAIAVLGGIALVVCARSAQAPVNR